MAFYKNIAVVGAGGVGEPIVKALVQNGANVTVLTRPFSFPKILPPCVAQIRIPTDYADVAAVAYILSSRNIEVVITAFRGESILLQLGIADAAKQAGVRLFVPSEFGFSTCGETEGPLGLKQRVVDYLQVLGIPYVRIFTGLFNHYYPWLVQYNKGKIHIVGDGQQKMSFTDLNDFVGFTAYVLTHLPPSQLENKIFRLQGESKTLLEVAELYDDRAKVVYVDGLEDPYPERLQRWIVALGKGSTGYDLWEGRDLDGEDAAGSANALWEGHRWTTLKESLGL